LDKISQCNTVEDWVETCEDATGTSFDDPLYAAQSWVYDLIKVQQVWMQGINGKGIHIRINDVGVDANHADIFPSFDLSASCESYLYDETEDGYEHGTVCASIAAGAANDECSVGIAFGATLSSCVALGPRAQPDYHTVSLDWIDISSNSYGIDGCTAIGARMLRRLQQCAFIEDAPGSPCSVCDFSEDSTFSEECESAISSYCVDNYENDVAACDEFLDVYVRCNYNVIDEATQAALDRGIKEGRDGKGIVYVFASGNEYYVGDDVNNEGQLNSRFTITVGAVGKKGLHASYSSTGAALFISAPGGDNEFLTNHVVAKPGGGCADATSGTSYACPVVAGVVALMLEANPELGWRDVQGILASTSQKTDPTDESWTTNAAGFHHSYKYGFGLVDAYAAVTKGETWKNYDVEQKLMGESGTVDILIADDPAATAISTIGIEVPADSVFTTESVVANLNLPHSTRGDLRVVLTSPEGTESILHPSKRPENTFSDEWKLMTVRLWGESPSGEWKLSIVDQSEGDLSDCGDLPDSHYGCDVLQECGDCLDGIALTADAQFKDEGGVSGADACCVCGGGQNAADIVNMLKSWSLTVYGRSNSTLAPPTSDETSGAFQMVTAVSSVFVASGMMMLIVFI
jgi:subtilisin family serine protease